MREHYLQCRGCGEVARVFADVFRANSAAPMYVMRYAGPLKIELVLFLSRLYRAPIGKIVRHRFHIPERRAPLSDY